VKKKENLIFKNHIPSLLFKKLKINKTEKLISKTVENIIKNIDKEENIFHSFSKQFKFSFKEKELAKYDRFKNIVIVGMGGSILGSKAIYYFLKHKIKKNFIFLDNLDNDKINKIDKKKNSNKFLFILISKSGNTIETLTNINILKNLNFTKKNTIVITENKNNALFNFAKKKNILLIKHKEYIGGRYSVLSEVGMLPAILMGLKVKNFRISLLKYFTKQRKKLLIENVVKIFQIFKSKKFSSIILLNYDPKLSNTLYWLQQLMAESLGKKNLGLLPIVSNAPKDHHSLLQLYIDGPKDKFFYIINSSKSKKLNRSKNFFGSKFKFLENKSLSKIVSSQEKAILQVFKNKNIPFRKIEIKKISEDVIGEFFSYFMIETILIGRLMNLNPFNQPSVEEVKILTKNFLNSLN
jgi:glucose-6-phosphate isomerase